MNGCEGWTRNARTRSCCPGAGSEDDDQMAFLAERIGKFDMYAEDDYAVFIRYCFADPSDAQEFRRRFEQRSDRFRLAG